MPPLPGAPDALPLGDVLDLAIASAPSRLPLRGAFSSQLALGRGSFSKRFVENKKILPINCEPHIPKPDGSPIRIRESMVYLGGLLHVSGKATAELTRRLSLATAHFHALCRLWKHAVLDTSKKVQIFSACIISKLM